MIVNRQELANAMGVSLPTIDKWVRDGCPAKTRGSKGTQWEFVVADVVAWWGNKQREAAAGAGVADEDELKRRAQAANTGRAELAFAREKGEVAPVREFEMATAKIMAAIRQNVMTVPQRAVLQLLGETDEATFKRKLKAELHLALEQSSVAEIDLDEDEEDEEGEE